MRRTGLKRSDADLRRELELANQIIKEFVAKQDLAGFVRTHFVRKNFARALEKERDRLLVEVKHLREMLKKHE